MALSDFMRPSLRKGAHAALSSAKWQEIRVRSGRDDNSSWKVYLAFPNKIVIPSEAEGSAVRPSGFPNSRALTQTLCSFMNACSECSLMNAYRVFVNERVLANVHK
jgi:hypothetical protein